MGFFDKKLGELDPSDQPVDPIELYETCAYTDGYGYLRGIQEEVLSTWHSNRGLRDVICKMNTGSGKTLTGLLMLYSKLVELKLPVLYLCPDKQLVEQTVTLSKLYGIPTCVVDSKYLPSDFINSKKILITTFQRLFNGKSVFNRDQVKIGAVVLDDAHKCVDIARENCSIKLPRNHEISEQLFRTFQEALKYQLPGTFVRLANGDPTMSMRVPYWTWMDSRDKILQIIDAYIPKIKQASDDDGLLFKWNFISDNLLTYNCYISGTLIELSPIHVPYHEVPSFNEAAHRYILSATFEDDYDLLKDLGISISSIQNPIVPKDRRDVGKRLILAPSRYDSSLTKDLVREFIVSYPRQNFNVIVLVPSENRAYPWIEVGAEYVDKDNIVEAVEKLKSGTGNFLVLSNRYDGLDLHADLCRILVIDDLPGHGTLQEQYTDTRMENLRAGRKAQIIEQGLGRGVRSGGDFCVVYLMGNDLLNFLGYEANLAHFTPVTRVQLKLGLELLDNEDGSDDPLKKIQEIANACLTQDSSWLKYHTREIAKASIESAESRKDYLLNIAEAERVAIDFFRQRRFEEAANVITSRVIGSDELSDKAKAWYYQFAAQMIYLGNPVQSNDLQSKASSLSSNMLHPANGHIYKKILNKGEQASLITRNLANFSRPQDVIGYLNGLAENLQYIPEIDAKSFERSLKELGTFLGFTSQMPEMELGNGPDVLWCLNDGWYLILEAKSRSTHKLITSENIRQLLDSEVWFKNQYGESAKYLAVTLQSVGKKGSDVNIHDLIKVLDQDALDLLKQNLMKFGMSLKSTHPKSHNEEFIAQLLGVCRFTPAHFKETYLKKIK